MRSMRRSSRQAATGACALLLGLAPPMPAQPTPTPVVVEGDAVAGVGAVTRIDTLAVNNAGDWLVEADTDHADTDADAVLLAGGALALREGDPLDGPPGIALGGFDSVTLNDAGQSGFNFFLDGSTGSSDDSSVHAYLDTAAAPLAGTVLVAQESEAAPGLTPGTPLIGFFDVKINDLEQLLVTASVDDPAIASSVDRALYLWTSDATDGGIAGSTLIAAEGDVLPGQAAALTDFGTGPHETALSDAGEVLFAVDITGGLDAIYHWDGSFTEIAQEGDASPVAGRSWDGLTSTSLDLAGSGGHAFRGSLDGDPATDSILVQDGAKLVQEGDTSAAIGGVFTFTSFGTGPVFINDSGGVLWYGDWDDPDTDVDTGLFLGATLLVQEGVTEVPGFGIVDTLRGITDGYQMSDNGRFVIFEAVLEDGREGAFLLELGDPIFADGFESGDTSAWD